MQKSNLLQALQQEIRRHNFTTFLYEIRGGCGVIMPGCSTCKKDFRTLNQFTDHLANDVLPALLERLAASADESTLKK